MSDLYIAGAWLVFKVGLVIFALLHFVFSLMVVRQVKLMTETVVTEAASGMRALSIFYALLSLGVIALLVVILF